MKTVYVLLTKTTTNLSRLIAHVSKDKYTHASISLDKELTQLYSFGRIFKRVAFIGGFVRETINGGIYAENSKADCAIYEIKVTDEAYAQITNTIKMMYKNKRKYRYNLLGLIYMRLGKDKKRKNKYFCSEFVTELLQDANAIEWKKSPRFTKPADYTTMEQANLVYLGHLGNAKI